MTWTEEQINGILRLKGADGELINVFDLYGVLHVGNAIKGHWATYWNLNKSFKNYGEGHLAISLEDFEHCEDEDDVRLTFKDCLEERVKAKLV